jgi:hypothetical protein
LREDQTTSDEREILAVTVHSTSGRDKRKIKTRGFQRGQTPSETMTESKQHKRGGQGLADPEEGQVKRRRMEVESPQNEVNTYLEELTDLTHQMKIQVLHVYPSGETTYLGDAAFLTAEMLKQIETLRSRFERNMGYKFSVSKVEYFKNKVLHETFAKTKLILEILGKCSEEVLLFHGTKEENIDRFSVCYRLPKSSILRDGFKVGGYDIEWAHGDSSVSHSFRDNFNSGKRNIWLLKGF